MSAWRRAASAVLASLVVAWLVPGAAYACSPLLEPPTIRALGPDQVVVVGTIGEHVNGGRMFVVERWFNGALPATPIVIAFKEGPAVGDCSYPVTTGTNLIIAPDTGPDRGLSADLVTLQADPSTDLGRKYVAEALSLFGPGIVPGPAAFVPDATSETTSPAPTPNLGALVAVLTIAVTLVFAVVILLARGQPDRT